MTQSPATLTKDLWNRIESFDIDGTGETGCAFPFVERLARENAWPLTFARRVVDEYRRFVFLAMTAGHPVTPSDQVDQAWHLHLTYTRSYWQRMCGEVLPKPLHHEPTKGGESENTKFDDWYSRTKESYTQIFGSRPPADIWPSANIRFHDDLHYERVNTKHNLIIPKRVAGRLVRFGVITGGAVMLLAGCTPLMLSQAGGGDVGMFIFIAMVVLIILVLFFMKRSQHTGGSGCGGSGGWWFGSSGCGTSHGGGHGHGDGSGSDGSSGCAGSGCAGSGCGGSGCGGGGD